VWGDGTGEEANEISPRDDGFQQEMGDALRRHHVSSLDLPTVLDRDMNKARTSAGGQYWPARDVENVTWGANALAAARCALTVACGHAAGGGAPVRKGER
jgi:hypothetical protein